MFEMRWAQKFRQPVLSVVVGVAVAVSAVGCGGSQKEVSTVKTVTPGAMPSGYEWPGVYYSQTYGYLHLTETGEGISGAWRTTAGDKWGELWGKSEGDVLTYTWKEHKVGQIGPNATTEGEGFFRFTIPREGEAPEIAGEWGLDDNNAGHTWTAILQENLEPDPKSVRPDELESRVGAGGWDDTQSDTSIKTEEEKPADPEGDGAEEETTEE